MAVRVHYVRMYDRSVVSTSKSLQISMQTEKHFDWMRFYVFLCRCWIHMWFGWFFFFHLNPVCADCALNPSVQQINRKAQRHFVAEFIFFEYFCNNSKKNADFSAVFGMIRKNAKSQSTYVLISHQGLWGCVSVSNPSFWKWFFYIKEFSFDEFATIIFKQKFGAVEPFWKNSLLGVLVELRICFNILPNGRIDEKCNHLEYVIGMKSVQPWDPG